MSSDLLQLDLFEHGREVMLGNDVIQALQRHEAAAARQALQRLSAEWPQAHAAADLGALVDALEARCDAPFGDHEALHPLSQGLHDVVTPAARRSFGEDGARVWLAVRWRELARRARALPYRAEHPDEHAAALWLRAGCWEDAAHAVEGIASWRRIPGPLAWMAEARLHLQGLPNTWAVIAELGWLAPRRLQALLARVPEPVLELLARRFGAEFDGDGSVEDLAWFAAWVLTERPQFAAQLAMAQASRHTAPERALRVVVELIGLERQGRHHDLVAHRKTLRELHAGLYAAYMKSR